MKIGQILIDRNLLQPIELKEALSIQQESGAKLGSILVELGYVSGIALAELLSKQLKLPSVLQDQFINVPSEVISKVPHYLAAEHRMFPLEIDERRGAIHLAFSDPPGPLVLPIIERELDCDVKVFVAPELWISSALERYYAIARPIHSISLSNFGEEFASLEKSSQKNETQTESQSPKFRPTNSPENDELGQNEYLKDILHCQSPSQVFKCLFGFMHVSANGILVFRNLNSQCKPFLLSGFPVLQKDFQNQDPRVCNKLSSKVKSLEKPNEFQVESVSNLLHPVLFDRLLELKPDQPSYIYPMFFRNSLQFVCLALPSNKHINLQKFEGLYPQAVNRAALALEYLFIKQELEKSFD